MGTGGLRVLAVTADGEVVASGQCDVEQDSRGRADTGIHEQEPESWWVALTSTMATVVDSIDVTRVSAISIDGTSGTLVCVDDTGRAVRPALMYNDGRATNEADELNEIAADFCDKLGYRIAASFAAAKIRWLINHEPDTIAQTRWFIHQADYVASRLCGERGVTDYSNALKTCYDLVDECWPDWMDGDRLPQRVVAPGTKVGELRGDVANELGLVAGIDIVAGASDGTAGFLASGARKVGDDNTTLGTTLVFKRVANALATHPDGLIYSHKLPGGFWLPGAASNTGGEWVRKDYASTDLVELDRNAQKLFPCDHIAYPLARTGERFPFRSSDAVGFCKTATNDISLEYAAKLQGTAFVERLCYQTLDEATGKSNGDVYATGGGATSNVWMQLRSDITGRTIHKPVCPESAFGSAVLAAAGHHGDVWSAIESMVRIEKTFEPNEEHKSKYDELYESFKRLLNQ